MALSFLWQNKFIHIRNVNVKTYNVSEMTKPSQWSAHVCACVPLSSEWTHSWTNTSLTSTVWTLLCPSTKPENAVWRSVCTLCLKTCVTRLPVKSDSPKTTILVILKISTFYELTGEKAAVTWHRSDPCRLFQVKNILRIYSKGIFRTLIYYLSSFLYSHSKWSYIFLTYYTTWYYSSVSNSEKRVSAD